MELGGTSVSAPPELDEVVALFPWLHDASVELVLRDFTDEELRALPTTVGRRADLGDPLGERYGLTAGDGRVEVFAPTAEGIFRGLTTVRQLVRDGAVPVVRILDGPRFAWRGLSLDTSRRFFPPDEVRQLVDLLALYKVNVLHLHLTDSEGWRIAIDSWPKLTEAGGFYTKEEYAALVAYAAERFVTIVPEIDLPGHAGAVFEAYPELAAEGVDGNPFLAYLHPDHPQVPGFVNDVLTELVALTPGGFIHLGGDETFGMPEELYERFIALVRPYVPALGKQLVVWQEATRSGALRADDLVQYWLEFDSASLVTLADTPDPTEGLTLPGGQTISPEILAAILHMLPKSQGDVDRAMATGNDVLVSLSTKAYLDTPYAEPSDGAAQEAERQRLGMPFYPKQTVAEFYDWDPATVHPRLPESSIAGVEAALWCESVESFADAMFLILPRLCGVAERAWSPAGGTWEAYAPRLAAQIPHWDRQGWRYFRSPLIGSD